MAKSKKIHDVSIPLQEGMIMYPGNPSVKMDWKKTPNTYLTKLSLGTHSGTHVDAPRHVRRTLTPVDEVDLNHFYGKAQVLDMTHCTLSVKIEDLAAYPLKEGDRVLLKTRNSIRGFKKFYDDYIFLDGDAAEYLANMKVLLVGIDSLSIKQRGSSDQRPHEALLMKGIPIIEGLDLGAVEPGRYTFIGFPLRLKGRDGSPIRAVLIDHT